MAMTEGDLGTESLWQRVQNTRAGDQVAVDGVDRTVDGVTEDVLSVQVSQSETEVWVTTTVLRRFALRPRT
jgi:riboflavin synthase alpha subunit